ncbi:MAG: hypothetical protein AAGF12_01705, partial [Myxococcota bacterium]
KWGKRILYLIVALPFAIAGAQSIHWLFTQLGQYRMVPLALAGLVVGGYAAQGFLPALSSHFSPREVYDTYNQLAAEDEPLGEFQVGRRAAAYYATGEVEEFATQPQLIEFLGQEGRRWAVFPTDELASVNRAFRQRTDRHLFVADARSSRVVLASNQAVEDWEDQNFVAEAVLDELPKPPDFMVNANFDNKIELVGYDLELPHEGYVGAGESFTVVWYYRVLSRVPGSYKVFLHVDGQGLRLNGDHDPVDGRYPVRLWDEGDIVVDRQPLDVPGNYRPGAYTFFIGFYSGSSRLTVTEGNQDGDNRVRAGIVRIR